VSATTPTRALLTVALGLALVAAACPPPEPPAPREISIKPFFKPSCDTICGSTCLACVDAMMVWAVDLEDNNLVEPQCLDIHGRWETLCDLPIGDGLLLLDEVPAVAPLVLKIRGFRRPGEASPDGGVDGGLACAPPAEHAEVDCALRNTSDLMLWGRSDPVRLSADAGVSKIEVKFECRADCDCLDIVTRPALCPADLPASACLSGTSCAKTCQDDDDCFQEVRPCRAGDQCQPCEDAEVCEPCDPGAGGCVPCPEGGVCRVRSLRCDVDAGVCDPASPGPGMLKPFCASCTSSSECEDNLCVGVSGVDGGYCARSCPDNACPRGAKCTRVDPGSGYEPR